MDAEGLDYELRYFRDRDGREVDFVVTLKKAPVLLVECKRSDRPVSAHLEYLAAKFPAAKAYQVSFEGKKGLRDSLRDLGLSGQRVAGRADLKRSRKNCSSRHRELPSSPGA